MNTNISLQQLGWQSFYQQQLSLEDFEELQCGRIVAHHRSEYIVQLEQQQIKLPITANLPTMTVGDWLLLSAEYSFSRLLERKSLISRKAAGTKVNEQFIAANIDSLFIVSSLNQDFSLSRIERYLALAHQAQITPVIILTKMDLCDDATPLIAQVQALEPYLAVEAVNGLDENSCAALRAYCRSGNTVSVVGSSGVGKSTLINTLLGESTQATAGIREDDAKGRHTTTARSIHFMPSGAILLDTPGMRELQLPACESGVKQTFADIEALAYQCRFSDCQHENEPGCAVIKAINQGDLDTRRLDNYRKLLREQAHNADSLQQKRAKDKALSKMYRQVQTGTRQQKKGF
ncbi:GTPase RsgA [Catenovulum agarivorans DS-2]|uniref:Small ribosomal subunit biogenesis GTPase RsgA n=1 Tax=Catenovulum agarivorans DS-2 TaxID=1328313 RepID=W7R2T3_9ALTE|nr:ribosome small subunit-dependent GTPase A [Catenovulum agarivorans]EWH11945.1 GTPase RsgA [Catenovulum agarivorans DS-2]